MNFIQIGRYKANANARHAMLWVILANKKLDWIIFDQKVSSIDLILQKLDNLNKRSYYRFSLFRIKWRSLNTSYNTLKFFISRASDFNFDIHKNLGSVYLENTDFSCICPTRNSNLPKRSYPDVSNGKANISPDSCYRNEYNHDRKTNSHVELFPTSNSIEFRGFHIAKERRGWCADFVTSSSTVIISRSKITMSLYWQMQQAPCIFHIYKDRH